MGDFLLTIFGAFIGWLISHYYYKKALARRLVPYIFSWSRVLAGIDKDVRKELSIRYRGTEVTDLTDVQLLIANEGDRAIKDCVKPLHFYVPSTVSLLDVALLHRHPAELQIELQVERCPDGRAKVTFDVPLLNAGDHFLIKLFINGDLPKENLIFNIIAEDLPASLTAKSLPFSRTDPSSRWEKPIQALVAIGFMGGSAWLVFALFKLWQRSPNLFPFPWDSYQFSATNMVGGAAWLLLILVFGLVSLVLFIDVADSYRHRRFSIPGVTRRPPDDYFEDPEAHLRAQVRRTRSLMEALEAPHGSAGTKDGQGGRYS